MILPGPVRNAVDAANRGDAEAFLDSFVPTGVVDDWGREFAGREAIRGWSDAEFIGKRVSLAVTDAEEDGATTVVTADVGGDGFNGPSHFTFTADGPLLSRMAIRA